MEKCSVKKVSVTTGIVAATMHTVGVIAIQLGVLNYVEWVHFVTEEGMGVKAISATPLILGIVTAFVIGSIVGAFFAWVYNKVPA